MTEVAAVRPTVAVLGGAVAGLAAAHRFADFADVTLFERQSYADKRVNCGEAINEASLVPLAKTPKNGFRSRIEGFDRHVYRSTDRDPARSPLATATLRAEDGYVTDRDVVERRWAARLRERGVDVREDRNVSVARYRDLVEAYDYVVDATGQPALSLNAAGRTDAYTGDTVALNADVEGTYETPARPSSSRGTSATSGCSPSRRPGRTSGSAGPPRSGRTTTSRRCGPPATGSASPAPRGRTSGSTPSRAGRASTPS